MNRWAFRAVALFALPLVLYAAAALVLGLVPVNRSFQPAPDGVPVYLRTNGTHVDIVVPTRTPQWDFSVEFPAEWFPRLGETLPWIAFGWGDRDFLLNTPTWADVRPVDALRAVSGQGRGAMHVEYVDDPGDFRVLGTRLDQAQYARLVAHLRGAFGRDAAHRPQRIDHPGYGATDAFFEGTGRYLPWLTSNEWARRALAAAGVRTAAWAPFEPALWWHAERLAQQAPVAGPAQAR